ncbi:hypothetical protein [Desulfovibrio desulfuricans]|uniref:hypothetical protein n=1 Tax=Desulfovibrio desulfuricans TaxID=876 RepID=UPI0035B33D50
MTLPYSPSRAVYQGNGAATAFPFAFKVWSTDQLSVSVTSPDGFTAPAQGWTASLGECGGTLTYLHEGAPLPAGWRLAIVRDMPFAQGIDLVSASRFDPQVIEDGLDQATAELQQLNEKIARAVILPATSDQSPEDVVRSVYGSRDEAAHHAAEAAACAQEAAASATAAASNAGTAAQTVQTATAAAVNAATAQADAAALSAAAAARSAEDAAAASGGMAPRMDAAEQINAQQDNRLDAVESDVAAVAATLIGSVQSLLCTDSYVPNGCVPANGGEYTRAQFPALYDAYLAGGRLLTCTYTAWAAQVAITGNCGKFALDTVNQKFKVPLFKDGDSITQAASAAELGKSVKAGLPNLTGDTSRGPSDADVGYMLAGATPTGVFKKGRVVNNVIGGSTATAYALAFDASGASSIYGNSTTVTDEQVRLRHFVVLASAQNSASVFDWSNYMTALAGKANVDLSNATGNAIGLYLYARDEKASGTHGGTSAAAAWQTRDLNTLKMNNLGGASLASNRITLPAGRYYVRGKAPAYAASNTRCAIYDATNAAYLLHGNSMTANQSYYGYVCPEVEGEFTLAAQTTIELRMYTGSAIGSYGLGFAVGTANINEVYSELRIWKM